MLQKTYMVFPNSDFGENSLSASRQGYWFNCVKYTSQTQENLLSLEAPAESDGMVSLTRADFLCCTSEKNLKPNFSSQKR